MILSAIIVQECKKAIQHLFMCYNTAVNQILNVSLTFESTHLQNASVVIAVVVVGIGLGVVVTVVVGC